MHQAYCNVFERLGLDYRPVIADTGSIGGSVSHEFHVLAESGEDAIAFSSESDYAANIEKAEAVAPSIERPAPSKELNRFDTPNAKTIEELKQQHGVKPHRGVKTLIAYGVPNENEERGLVALVVRGDHELNELKAEKLAEEFVLEHGVQNASDEEIKEEFVSLDAVESDKDEIDENDEEQVDMDSVSGSFADLFDKVED